MTKMKLWHEGHVETGLPEVVEMTCDNAVKLIDLLGGDDPFDDLTTAVDEACAAGLGDGKVGYIVIKISED